MTDPFPPDEFDDWAVNYDQAVANTDDFPFTGYEAVLDKVVELASPNPGMSVLDLGTGTGNLALRFQALGCQIWGTDFSASMLEKARGKLPQAKLFLADLRANWPAELNRRFDRIVSGYVFHHFELPQKIQLSQKLVSDHLESGGRLLIADIAFADQAALDEIKQASGDEWEDEFYWLADETLPCLAEIGLRAKFHRISSCAGVFEISD